MKKVKLSKMNLSEQIKFVAADELTVEGIQETLKDHGIHATLHEIRDAVKPK